MDELIMNSKLNFSFSIKVILRTLKPGMLVKYELNGAPY